MSTQAMSVFGGQLPDPKALAQATERYKAETENMGKVYMKFKEGAYMYGSDNTEPQEGSHWAVNPWGVTHSWVLFDNKFALLDQKSIVPSHIELSAKPEDPSQDISKSGWQEQWTVPMMCLNGDDQGLEVVFNTSSAGGVRACKGIMASFSTHVNDGGEETPIPVVELLTDSYYNKTYRRTVHTPVFKIVDFIGADDLAGMMGGAVESEEEAPAKRTRKAVKEEAPEPPKPKREPVQGSPIIEEAVYEEPADDDEEPPVEQTPRKRRSAIR